ncbi:hypothetical protein M3Y98_00547600 [Aphelenchoides besseyi]|nr:hypothetical protein M3Y98_00547600 [Aphelenchoides besseyi]KAI6208191.1 hypothetical protein M3Y96_00088900 [Aphelenchoides besseyi]
MYVSFNGYPMSLRWGLLTLRRSSWIADNARRAGNKTVDVERAFIERDVQKLLQKLTGLDLHGKVFRERNINVQERSHYALMTENMFHEAVRKMENRGRKFLQFVPVKEPRENKTITLSEDPEISGFDQSKFVFTDITFDATNRNRLVVVRETDGKLRTANPEEHDRMNRVYYEQSDRPVIPPKIFSEPYLSDALKAARHEFVLDWACYFYEPDDSEFVRVSRVVFDHVVENECFELLHSTRHFGPLVFYLILNRNLPPLLRHFCSSGSLNNVADVVRLQQLVYPDWRTASAEGDSDEKVVENFVKQNRWVADRVPELSSLLNGNNVDNKESETNREQKRLEEEILTDKEVFKKRVTTRRENLHTSEGPLGPTNFRREAADYPVRLTRKDDQQADPTGPRPIQGSRRFKPRRNDKDKHYIFVFQM